MIDQIGALIGLGFFATGMTLFVVARVKQWI